MKYITSLSNNFNYKPYNNFDFFWWNSLKIFKIYFNIHSEVLTRMESSITISSHFFCTLPSILFSIFPLSPLVPPNTISLFSQNSSSWIFHGFNSFLMSLWSGKKQTEVRNGYLFHIYIYSFVYLLCFLFLYNNLYLQVYLYATVMLEWCYLDYTSFSNSIILFLHLARMRIRAVLWIHSRVVSVAEVPKRFSTSNNWK